MNLDLNGFKAVITGGSSGLGLEMSKALASHGAAVAIAARAGEKLDKAYAALAGEGYDVHALAMDVRSESSVNAAAAWVGENWGRLDMLVNNAGISLAAAGVDLREGPKPFYEIPPAAFYDIVETNFIGYFLVARAFVPIMLRQGSGRLVNVSTSIRTMTAKGQVPYGPSRAGAEAMVRIITDELKDSGIMVNVILPGGRTFTGLMPDYMRILPKSPDTLDPDILNEVILFLASPKADGMYGERIIGNEFHKWLEDKGIDLG